MATPTTASNVPTYAGPDIWIDDPNKMNSNNNASEVAATICHLRNHAIRIDNTMYKIPIDMNSITSVFILERN
jgi:hypothetical protein